ncbi:MAG: penicillin-binding protein activator [Patescibacteria group bacterium]
MENMEQTSGGGGGSTGKWIIGLIVLALVIWGLVAANKNKNGDKGTENKEAGVMEKGPYKVGVLLPLTGDAAVYGEPLRNVIEIAASEINAEGKIKLEVIFEDGKCNGKDATSAIQKLVNVDKVQFVLGGGCSGESLAAIPVAEQAKVVMVSALSTNPKLTGISPYFFRLAPSDSAQGVMDADLANKKGYKTVAALVEQTDYATGVYDVFNTAFTKYDGKTVKEEYPSESGDFRTQLTKLKAANADALLLVSQSATAAGKILKQMQGMNWKPQIIITESLTTDAQFLMDYKDMLEGAYGAEFKISASNEKFKKLSEVYKTKHGKELPYGSFSAAVYDTVYIFADGVNAVGYNGEKLAQWSRTIKNWPGASGDVTIKPDGDSQNAYSLSVVKGGKLEPYTE